MSTPLQATTIAVIDAAFRLVFEGRPDLEMAAIPIEAGAVVSDSKTIGPQGLRAKPNRSLWNRKAIYDRHVCVERKALQGKLPREYRANPEPLRWRLRAAGLANRAKKLMAAATQFGKERQ